MTKKDLCIVGGGILGTAHAYHALEKGLSVTLIEREGAPVQSSTMNFGQVVPSGQTGIWRTYGKRSVEIYKHIQKQGNIHISSFGSYYLAETEGEQAVLEEFMPKLIEEGFDVSILSTNELCEKIPFLKKDYAKIGIFVSDEVSAEPRKTVKAIQDFLVEKHPQLFNIEYLNTAIHVEQTNNASIVKTAKGQSHEAEKIIICTGRDYYTLFPELYAQSGLIVSKLNMMRTLPITTHTIKGNLLTGTTIRRYDGFKETKAYHLLEKAPRYEILKELGIHILFKQGADGSIIIGDSHEYAPANETYKLDFEVRMDMANVIINEAQKVLDLPSWEMTSHWAGFYAQHETKEVFERSISDRIHIVTGIGGKGMTTSLGFAENSLEKILNT
ncbi:MAG: TIGR03364 family FAD-dependent oxidoreductase [Cytophagales bacterium]